MEEAISSLIRFSENEIDTISDIYTTVLIPTLKNEAPMDDDSSQDISIPAVNGANVSRVYKAICGELANIIKRTCSVQSWKNILFYNICKYCVFIEFPKAGAR